MPKIIIHEEVLAVPPEKDGDYHFFKKVRRAEGVFLVCPDGLEWWINSELPEQQHTEKTSGCVSIGNGMQESTMLKVIDTALRAITPSK